MLEQEDLLLVRRGGDGGLLLESRDDWVELRTLGSAAQPCRLTPDHAVASTDSTITDEDLRDALEMLATVELSDQELAARGVRLSEHAVVIDGLGPSTFTLIELPTGESNTCFTASTTDQRC